MTEYSEFLARKAMAVKMDGIEPAPMPSFMKPHQADATSFALRAGRAGNFLDMPIRFTHTTSTGRE